MIHEGLQRGASRVRASNVSMLLREERLVIAGATGKVQIPCHRIDRLSDISTIFSKDADYFESSRV